MHIKDLICNPVTDRISHSKVWANVACAAATYKFLTEPAESEIWFAYLGLVGGYAAARRWIAHKDDKKEETND